VVAAAAASVALHALVFWSLRRGRVAAERPHEEPVEIDVLGSEPRETPASAPVRKPVASRERESRPSERSSRPSEHPSRPAEVEAPSARSPAPPSAVPPSTQPRDLDLGLHAQLAPLPNPAFDPKASPTHAPQPMEAPGTDVESVLEYKRSTERASRLPEAWEKLFADRGEPKPDYKVKPKRDGSKVYHDQRADRFDAIMAPDGTLAFDDHHIHAESFRKQWQKWLADPLHNAPPMPSLLLGIDITDEIMRAHGEDPYSAIKRKLLDDTLPERQKLADQYRRETMAAALAGLRPFLRALVADPTRSRIEKRRLLRELADECDDTPGGHIAREIIAEFETQLGNR
jgi:hypothetical protein